MPSYIGRHLGTGSRVPGLRRNPGRRTSSVWNKYYRDVGLAPATTTAARTRYPLPRQQVRTGGMVSGMSAVNPLIEKIRAGRETVQKEYDVPWEGLKKLMAQIEQQAPGMTGKEASLLKSRESDAAAAWLRDAMQRIAQLPTGFGVASEATEEARERAWKMGREAMRDIDIEQLASVREGQKDLTQQQMAVMATMSQLAEQRRMADLTEQQGASALLGAVASGDVTSDMLRTIHKYLGTATTSGGAAPTTQVFGKRGWQPSRVSGRRVA